LVHADHGAGASVVHFTHVDVESTWTMLWSACFL
jgi:hypothetical protein